MFHRVFRLLSFFGSRYIHKLELLPNSTVNVWTYDFVARPKVYTNVPIDAFRPSGYNDKGDYYKVKLRGYRWFFIMDKKGEIPYVSTEDLHLSAPSIPSSFLFSDLFFCLCSDSNAFVDVVHGKRPTVRY